MQTTEWVEIEKSAIEHNVREIKKLIGNNTLLCAVVKSNAYGHGIKEIADIVSNLPEVEWYAVNSLDEAIELKSILTNLKTKGTAPIKPILILGYIPLNGIREAIRNDFRITLYNEETVRKIQEERGKIAKCHLKIDTGMGRQGILPAEAKELIPRLREINNIRIEGVFTHFASADEIKKNEYSKYQIERFNKFLKEIKTLGLKPKIIHAANTAATICYPEAHFDMVRNGIGIYGMWPSKDVEETGKKTVNSIKLKPALSWKTKIAQIRNLPAGSYIGYGCTYRTTRNTRTAVLPVGYSTGFDRKLGNKAYVLINGRIAPILGRISMDITTVDVTNIPDINLESEVVILGRSGKLEISAETIASWLDTINYEIVTRISPLIKREVV